MPYNLKWYVEGRVMHIEFWGEPKFDEIAKAADEAVHMLDHSTGPLTHYIIDVTRLGNPSLNVTHLRTSVQSLLTHPKLGWVIPVGLEDSVLGFVSGIVNQLFRTRYRLAKTHEEALEFIRRVDESLKDIQ